MTADRTVPMICGVAAAGFVSAAICGHQFCVLLNDPFWCHDIDTARLLAVVMTGSIVATAFALHSLYCILSTPVKKTDTMRVDSEYFRCYIDRGCERIDPVWDQQKAAHFARVRRLIAGGYGDEYAHAVSVQLQKLYATHRPTTQSLRNTLIRRVTPAVSLEMCRRYNLPDGESKETDLTDCE